jgi:EAL domain-containing protein (putative c-di-GMP-specific phosphodiesterase class I)
MNRALIDQVVDAIERHEIRAYYQPQYDANSGRLVSAEALVRWVKPDGTIITPDEFVPLLEKSQDINILDWFMAEEACKTIRELGVNAIPIAVNFSRWHVKETDFSRKLHSLLTTYEISPKFFEVEITESALAVEDFTEVERWANELAESGISIAIDDFGAGFTSLQFVKDIPVNYLKVDKAFLKDNCQDDRGRGTLETVFYFAHRLHIKTICEGVETIEQLKFMQSMDCDKVQGFLFSRPVRKEDFLVLAMMNTMPAFEEDEYIKKQGTLSSHSMLISAIRKEFSLIIYGNLFKNSYYVMAHEAGREFEAPTAGVIDDMTEAAIKACVEEDKQLYKDTLSREALLKAYYEGNRRVETEISRINADQSKMTLHVIIHLLCHPYKEDVLMVGFAREIKNADEITNVEEINDNKEEAC